MEDYISLRYVKSYGGKIWVSKDPGMPGFSVVIE